MPQAADVPPVRARILPLTIAGILTLTTGVALAETDPADPEVVPTTVDDPTTTTVVEVPTTTETTVVAPPETTTTTTAVADEPDEVPQAEVAAPEGEARDEAGSGRHAPEAEAVDASPENHGLYVSRAARDHGSEGNHGAAVSAVARSDVGKPHSGARPSGD